MHRRQFISQAVAFSALAPVFPWWQKTFKTSMGIVVHSYAFRWQAKKASAIYPPFTDALQLLKHAHQIGAGGIQTVVNGWSPELSKSIRQYTEQHDLFIEASIALPKSSSEVDIFEANIVRAKEAGCDITRTVCLNGRRYENFHSLDEFKAFKKQSLNSISLALPVLEKQHMKLAIENHKDWQAAELAEIISSYQHPWLGVTLDFGNNLALLEDPWSVAETLAPFAFTTHVKDMGLDYYQDGFLLSEVVLGQGMCPLKKMVDICRRHNPNIRFNLEMITRDPLKIPCQSDDYWSTFGPKNSTTLSSILAVVQKHHSTLPYVAKLDSEQQHSAEENNVLGSLKHAYKKLHL